MAHPKGVLLERAAKLGFERPEFRTERTGPEHEPQFLADVIVAGEVLGTGQGSSKRTAETRAAEEALEQLDAREDTAKAGETSRKRAPAPAGRKSDKGSPKAGKAGEASKAGATPPAKANAGAPAGATAARAAGAAAKRPAAQSTRLEEKGTEMADGEFDGPWPMFDDLLASALEVAERRVNADLRGAEARAAIRDFSLSLYKELLSELGDVVEDDDEEADD